MTSGTGAIHFYGPVQLDDSSNSLAIQTAGGAGDNINFDATVQSLNAASASLTGLILNPGASGIVTMTGIVGAGSTLNTNPMLLALTIGSGTSNGTIALANVYAWKGISVTTSTTTTLNGSTYTVVGNTGTADLMTWNTPLVMTQSPTTFTGGGETADAITFGQSLNGNVAVVINGGLGATAQSPVSFTGIVGTGTGNANRPSALTVNNAGTITFGSSSWINGDIALYATGLGIASPLNAEGTGNISLYSNANYPATTIGIGTGAGTLSISQASWDNLRTASTITVGQTGIQSGLITIAGSTLDGALATDTPYLTSLTINSNVGAGGIVLDGTSATALNANGAYAVSLNSGTSGIAVFESTNTSASIANTAPGLIALATGATSAPANIGTSTTKRLKIAVGSGNVVVSNGLQASGVQGALYLRGLGSLTFGVVTTGNRLIDVDTIAGANDVNLKAQVNSGSGDQTYSPARNLNLNFAGTVILTSGANLTVNAPTVVNLNATIAHGAGAAGKKTWFKTATATVDDLSSGAHTLVIDSGTSNQGDVELDGPVGATTALQSFTIQNSANVTMANIGSATQDGVTQALSVQGNSSLTLTGTIYRTTGSIASVYPQTWKAGIAAASNINVTATAPVLFQTQGKLNIEGNFLATGAGANVTMTSNDIGLNPAGALYGIWNLGGNQLNFYTQIPATLMKIGVATGAPDAAGEWHLDQSELASLDNAGSNFAKIVFGQSGATGQSGAITVRIADLSAANGGNGVAVDINASASAGTVTFDTNSNASNALNLKSGNLTVNAYSSINSAQVPNTPISTYSDLVTTGTIILNTDGTFGDHIGAGPISTYASGYPGYKPITIAAGESIVNVGGKNSNGVFLMGVGASVVLGTVTIDGTLNTDIYNDNGIIYLTKNIATGGYGITYNSPVRLRPNAGPGNNITIDTTGSSDGSLIFENTFDDDNLQPPGTNSLTIKAGTASVSFVGPIGNAATTPKPIGGLTIQTAGAVSFGTNVSTAKAGLMTGAVLIDHSGLLDFGAGNPVWTLAGSFTEQDSSGLNSGFVHVQGTLNTSGNNAAVTFNRPVTLTGDAILTSGSGAISFGATLDGAHNLTVSGPGITTFTVTVGNATPLASLSLGGPSAINGGSVSTTGAQTYTGGVSVGANTTFTGNSGSLVWFKNTLGAASPHSVQVATANAQFDGAVSGNLASLSVGGTTAINGGSVSTTGAQTYTGAVSLGANTTFTGNSGSLVWFKNTLGATSPHSVQVATANAQFDGAVSGNLTSLSVGGTSLINKSGTGDEGALGHDRYWNTAPQSSIPDVGSELAQSAFDGNR